MCPFYVQGPYGIPAIWELFRFLVGLINPKDHHNTETMVTMGLSLMTVAMETGGRYLHNFPSLIEVSARVGQRSRTYR